MIRKGRKIVGIDFELWDKGTKTKKQKLTTGKLQIDVLTFAQQKAYTKLMDYGIKEEIVLEMLSRVKGSEMAGFEDWYFESIIQIFESKTKQTEESAKAGTFVNWFLKKKIFEQEDHFARIMEQLQARKKKLQTEHPEAWENRLIAKTMTSSGFTKRFNS